MRRDFATDSSVSTTGLRAVLVAGGLGSGAGLIADIIADVVRLSLGRVERRRKATGLDRGAITIERLDIDPTAAELRRDGGIGLAILCDERAAAALAEVAPAADELIAVADEVPAWRQNLLPAGPTDTDRIRSIDAAARGVAQVSRRFSYAGELWRRSLARHVPKRYRQAALARFDAELTA